MELEVGQIYGLGKITREILEITDCKRFVKCRTFFQESNKLSTIWYWTCDKKKFNVKNRLRA